MKYYPAVLLAAALLPSAVTAQDAFKCRTPAGYVYQDQPCKAAAPAEPSTRNSSIQPSSEAPISDAQARLDRDKKYLADRAYIRQKTEAHDRVTQCENEAYSLQNQADATAHVRLTEYVPNRVGIAQMQLDESRRQTLLSNAQARVEAKRRDCDALRRDAERFK